MTFVETVQLTKIDCGNCGGIYAISERYRAQKYEAGGSWTCPYCQRWWGYATNENSQLKKELEQAQNSLRASKCEALNERTLREKAEAEKSRIQRRVHSGVCPCCKRRFQNLRRHMETKHPTKA